MGQRGEVFSTRVFLDDGQKTFFFNVKENRYHDYYVNIVESRKTDTGFKRSSLVVFDDDIEKFMIVLEKTMTAIRERKGKPEETLIVGGGRREYVMKLPPRGKPALHLSEKREDATGTRRESVIVPVNSFDIFLEGLGKAVTALKKA